MNTTTNSNRRLWIRLLLAFLLIAAAPGSDRCCGQTEWFSMSDASLHTIDPHIEYHNFESDSSQTHECCSEADFSGGEPERRFKLTEFNIYPTFSFLGDQVGNYAEFEFASITQIGRFEMENRTVMNVADLPGTIKLGPTNPGSRAGSVNVRGNGFGDILSGFFFSRKNRQKQSHLAIGPVATFPAASNSILGSNQYTLGPGVHFSTEVGRWDLGFFMWQSWGLTNNPAKKQVNQLFGKPFFVYKLSEKWNLISIPLGMSHSWKSPQGDDWTVPVGGGVRRLFKMRDKTFGLQFQAFDYVARKPADPEWELRFTIEYLFD